MSKKKPNYIARRKQEHVNKKAIYWIGGVVVVLIAAMSVLLILNQ